MGSQFSLIYDVIVAVILVGMIFSGARKGFVGTVISMAAVVVGFLCAMTFSRPLSEQIYTSVVEEPVKEAVSSALDESMGQITLSGLSGMDYDKIRISGTLVGDIVPDYSGTDKAVFDLSSVDFTGTGLDEADLSRFGFDGSEDLSAMNGKSAEFTMGEINRNGLGRLVTAQVIAVKLQDTSLFGDIADYAEAVGSAVPGLFGGFAEQISGGEVSALRTLVLTMEETSSSVKTAVVDKMIRPVFIVAVETIAFGGIFVIVAAVLGIIGNATKVVNKIPVIGGLNGFLGALAGVVRGLLAVFIVCIVVRLIVSVTGGSVILLNDTAIEQTYIFKLFYNFDFLNFMK